MKKTSYLKAFCSFFLGTVGSLVAADASWSKTIGGDWTVPGNWTVGGPPMGMNAIASFGGLPLAPSIVSSSPITIGSLHLDSSVQIDIAFGGNSLTFSQIGSNARLFSSGSSTGINNFFGSDTPIILDSDLDIFIRDSGNLEITGNISGGGSLNIYGSTAGTLGRLNLLNASGNDNTFSDTFVYSGLLSLSFSSGNIIIPKNVTVSQKGQISHGDNDFYSSTDTNMTVDGGFVDLSGTQQHMRSLTVKNNGIFGDTIGGAILDLSASSGNTITLAENGMIENFVFSATMEIHLHGGAIAYDATDPGTAFIGQGNPIIVDLGGSTDIIVPHNFFNCVDLESVFVTYQNGPLNKTNNGVLVLKAGTVPTFNIEEGTVIIGRCDMLPTDPIHATGPVTVFSGAILGGCRTIDAQMGVTNSGTVRPGNACSGCSAIGTLTIDGDYAQTSGGVLLIKALSESNADLLVVENGVVNLNGTLIFDAQPNAILNVGDKILVLDNLTGSTAISGTFSSLISNIPPQLTASILQDPNQVFVFIGPCSPFVSPVEPPFTNLGGPIFTLTNAHSLRQRQRMLNLRERLPCVCCAPISSIPVEEKVYDWYEKWCPVTRRDQENPKEIDTSDSYEEEKCNPLTLYAAALGSLGDVDGISKQRGYDFDSVGGLLGANYAFYRGGLGVELGYEHVNAYVDDHWGNFGIQSVFGSIYGTLVPISHLFFDLAVETRANWYTIHRHTSEHTAKGHPHSWQWDAFADIGYDVHLNDWRITPLASLEYIHLHIDDYKERGAGQQNVIVGHQNYNSLRTWLGMSAGGSFGRENVIWMPEIRGFWLHEFASEHHKVNIRSTVFNTHSQIEVFGGNRDYGIVGSELRILFAKQWSLTASYDYYWNRDIQTHLLYGELAVSF